jgi:hypothetical protein
VPRTLLSLCFLASVLLSACGGGGGGGGDATSSNPGVSPPPVTTPATASFAATAAYRAYNAPARQQNFLLSPFGFCAGSATLTETAPAAATFEGSAALRKTSTLAMRFTNCTPGLLTRTTDVYQNASNDQIGLSRFGYAVLDRPLVLPATVKVGDSGALASATIYSDQTKTTVIGAIAYSFSAQEDNRADAILVRITAAFTDTLGGMPYTELKNLRLTSAGVMELVSMSTNENGNQFIFFPQ